jgi:hypothetical protein
MYDLELIPELKSELGEEYDLVIELLLHPRSAWEASKIHRVLTDDPQGRKGPILTEMLLSKLKMEIRDISSCYEETYGQTLSEAILVNVAGDLQIFLIALFARASPTPPAVTTNTPEDDAELLCKIPADTWIVKPGDDSAVKKKATDNDDTSQEGDIDTEGYLTKMLQIASLSHIRSSIEAFNANDENTHSLLEVLEKNQTEDFMEAFKTFLAWLQNPYAYYADNMHAAILEVDVESLTTLLITRAEDGHMPMVRKMYRKRWQSDVVDDLKSNITGNIVKVMSTAAKMTKMLTPTLVHQSSARSLLSDTSLETDLNTLKALVPPDFPRETSPLEDKIIIVPQSLSADVSDQSSDEKETKDTDTSNVPEESPQESKDVPEVSVSQADSAVAEPAVPVISPQPSEASNGEEPDSGAASVAESEGVEQDTVADSAIGSESAPLATQESAPSSNVEATVLENAPEGSDAETGEKPST